jgi:hypothetical protein
VLGKPVLMKKIISNIALCILILLYAGAAMKEVELVPIIFVYTFVPKVCTKGNEFPSYIRYALSQAVESQSHTEIIFGANFADCKALSINDSYVEGVTLYDTSAFYKTFRLSKFSEIANSIFQTDGKGELWMTSALRFFVLEDIMLSMGYQSCFHVEADNMLYGDLYYLLSTLKSKYIGFASTPLTDHTYITASVMWISNISYISNFNDMLLTFGDNESISWNNYLSWLRPQACCKLGGFLQDSAGMGIRPYAINEMSILSFYRFTYPQLFHLFPVVPQYSYILNQFTCNISDYEPNGTKVISTSSNGIFDPNSWGQFLGGTSSKRGRNKGFTDGSHISGQAIRMSNCRPLFLCTNTSLIDVFHKIDNNVDKRCYMIPYVECNDTNSVVTKTPIYNLHVHAKDTRSFRSLPCECSKKKLIKL